MRVVARLLFGCVLLCGPVVSTAEPSSAFQKCQAKLEKSASVHVERADKIRDKHARRLAEILTEATRQESPERAQAMRSAADRIQAWRQVEQARSNHVDKIIKDVADLVSPDGPGFQCLDHGRVLKVYLNNQLAYEKVLENVELDVVAHFELEDLAPDEGLVMISYSANNALTYVRANRRGTLGGNIVFRPLRTGLYYRLIKAKAGDYVWEVASKDLGNFYRSEYRLRQFDLGFTVKPGAINYTGVFLIEAEASGYFRVYQNDRLVIALHLLEERYPELMGRYEIANGLHADDRFTEFYMQERASYLEDRSGGT